MTTTSHEKINACMPIVHGGLENEMRRGENTCFIIPNIWSFGC